MGIRTDLTSLGAIGIGAAIAVVGSGALLFAAVSSNVDADVCIDVPMPPVAPAPGPDAHVTVAEISESGDMKIAVAVSDAPEAPTAAPTAITISENVMVRSGCVTELRSGVREVRVRALADAENARMRAGEARGLAKEIRAEIEAARAEAGETGEISSERIRELVDAALAEAGLADVRR